jgi:hypothetical protein
MDIGVIIGSCDRYADVWPAFFKLFDRYWPECPWPVYLQSNYAEYQHPRVTSIKVGHDQDWSSSFQRFLEAVPHQYVLVLLEDYLLYAPVNTPQLQEISGQLGPEIAHIRLLACPGPTESYNPTQLLGNIVPGAPYRVSLQAAFWNKKVLSNLLVPGESAWSLEVNGSRRSDSYHEQFLSVWPQQPLALPYFCTAVEKGRWLRPALKLLKREGIAVNSTRAVEPHMRAWARSLGVLPYYHQLRAWGAKLKHAL